MRNVRLGDNHRAGGNRLGNGAEKLDELVGLLKVNAARSRYFPHEPNGIQSNIPRPFNKVMQQHVDHRNQYLRRGEVEIDLVLTEGGPQMSHAAIMKCERRKKR